VADATLDIVKAMRRKTITVQLKRVPEFRFRVRVAKLLIRLAGRVLGVNTEVVDA